MILSIINKNKIKRKILISRDFGHLYEMIFNIINTLKKAVK